LAVSLFFFLGVVLVLRGGGDNVVLFFFLFLLGDVYYFHMLLPRGGLSCLRRSGLTILVFARWDVVKLGVGICGAERGRRWRDTT
jgi:hypothetical protein